MCVGTVTTTPRLDTSDLGTHNPPAVPSNTSKPTFHSLIHQNTKVQNGESSSNFTQFTYMTPFY